MDISIVIPVFNEEKNLEILNNQICTLFDNLNKSYEVIYVDDGSTDNSFNILNRIKSTNNNIKLIKFDKNYGQTAALGAGLKMAKGEFILTIDADLQFNVKDFIRILKGLGNSDVVIGYKDKDDRIKIDGYIRFTASKIANYVRNKVLNEDFKDTGCFLRGFRRECISKLELCKGGQLFVISLLNMKGYRIKEIPVKVYPRKFGESKYTVKKLLFESLPVLLMVKLKQKNLLKYKIESCD